MDVKKRVIAILLAGASLNIAQGFASKVTELTNCRHVDLAYKDDGVVLNPNDQRGQRLYLIHNQSKNTLWVDHPTKHPGASAGWASKISVDEWSALAVKDQHFGLTCVEIKPGSEQFIPCKGAISICELVDAQFQAQSVGTYWVAETKPLDEILHTIQSRGIDIGARTS